MKRIAMVSKPGAEQLAGEVCARLAQAGLEVVEDIEACDALIAIGGDGTILEAARVALPHGKPVLGINAGRLGFLAGLERRELEQLPRLAADDYELEHRMLLRAEVWQGEQCVAEGLCLNDAVVARHGVSHTVEVQVDCGDEVIAYRGDGVIFSTPTGSTAYNFAAGGPVVEAKIESILLTPVCNHRLFTRTIVFSESTRFSVDITGHGLALNMDAQPPVALQPGQRVTVRRAGCKAAFIRLKPGGFLYILNEKMGGRI